MADTTLMLLMIKGTVQNDILCGGKLDHPGAGNCTLHGNWTLLMVEISIFPTCSGV